MNAGQRYFEPVVIRNVYAGNDRHVCSCLALGLLVLDVGAQDANRPSTANDLALRAHRLYRGSNLHLTNLQSLRLQRYRSHYLLKAVGDSTTSKVVRRQLDQHAIPGKDSNEILANLP